MNVNDQRLARHDKIDKLSLLRHCHWDQCGSIACLQSRDFLLKWRAIEQLAHDFSQYLSGCSDKKRMATHLLRLKMSLILKGCSIFFHTCTSTSKYTPLLTSNNTSADYIESEINLFKYLQVWSPNVIYYANNECLSAIVRIFS